MTDARPTVLLVEDDDLLRESVALLLDAAGYHVHTAGSAAAALGTVTDARPDVVILDLGLPDRPGLDVAREIRKDPASATLPIIALTGRVGVEQEAEAIQAGCDRFLGKPVATPVLLDTLSALVNA